MKRAIQVIRALEGFKLGSLGVSRKPKVTVDTEQPVPTEPIVDKVKGYADVSGDPGYKEWIGGYTWSESNGYNFLMVCFVVEDNRSTKRLSEYQIKVFGGKGLNVPSIRVSPERFPKDAAFTLEYTFFSKETGDVLDVLIEKMNQVRNWGSFGKALASGGLKSNWRVEDINGVFEGYIWDRANVRKNVYFSYH
jgi:hypothetical protein